MDSIATFVTILLVIMSIGLALAVAAVFLVNSKHDWWNKL
ncbi:Uncharacterized [Syntrophomonas zehnderi OL-4]|uniref:Uncharacterized n=1 Tax=Syntrophomonas zehnderi OL-4 TaxID=690567 RepID=A0A0E4C9S5_9FIRM|nr:Uncharacterized [Syntrophomonas zehnderi OL-4]